MSPCAVPQCPSILCTSLFERPVYDLSLSVIPEAAEEAMFMFLVYYSICHGKGCVSVWSMNK